MHGVGPKVLDRKELLDLMLNLLIGMLDKQDRGLRPIGVWPDWSQKS